MYRQPDLVKDEATPYLVPTAVAFASIAIWGGLFTAAFPWDWFPMVETCHNVVTTTWTGRVRDVHPVCSLAIGERAMLVLVMVMWTAAATVITVAATVRALTTHRRPRD